MPRHAPDNLAETFAKILCERASFELKEDDINAYRQHISSLQQAAQFTAAARAQEEEEFRQWKVHSFTSHFCACHTSVLCVLILYALRLGKSGLALLPGTLSGVQMTMEGALRT